MVLHVTYCYTRHHSVILPHQLHWAASTCRLPSTKRIHNRTWHRLLRELIYFHMLDFTWKPSEHWHCWIDEQYCQHLNIVFDPWSVDLIISMMPSRTVMRSCCLVLVLMLLAVPSSRASHITRLLRQIDNVLTWVLHKCNTQHTKHYAHLYQISWITFNDPCRYTMHHNHFPRRYR